MQHVGIQHTQGAQANNNSMHYNHAEISTNIPAANSTTSILRNYRKKDATEKLPLDASNGLENQGPVARVAPHAHYPKPNNEIYRYPQHYGDFNMQNTTSAAPPPVKYSEIIEQPMQAIDHHLGHMVQKPKEKTYLEMCNQSHMKAYPENYFGMRNVNPMAYKQQFPVNHHYMQKESQISPGYQQKDLSYMANYKMPPTQYPRYPRESNEFLSNLNKIAPDMAQEILNDPHLREQQFPMYLEQNRLYQQSHQRMYQRTSPIHPNPNFNQRNVNYNQYQMNQPRLQENYRFYQPQPNLRYQQIDQNMQQRYEGLYPSRISPNFPPCSQLEYSQHYQHRQMPVRQDFLNPMTAKNFLESHPEIPEIIPDETIAPQGKSLKTFLENWNEETFTEDAENSETGEKAPSKENTLYVLDAMEIPSENIPQYIHLQSIDKLPPNIRGFYAESADQSIVISSNLKKDDATVKPTEIKNGIDDRPACKLLQNIALNSQAKHNFEEAYLKNMENPPVLQIPEQPLKSLPILVHEEEDATPPAKKVIPPETSATNPEETVLQNDDTPKPEEICSNPDEESTTTEEESNVIVNNKRKLEEIEDPPHQADKEQRKKSAIAEEHTDDIFDLSEERLKPNKNIRITDPIRKNSVRNHIFNEERRYKEKKTQEADSTIICLGDDLKTALDEENFDDTADHPKILEMHKELDDEIERIRNRSRNSSEVSNSELCTDELLGRKSVITENTFEENPFDSEKFDYEIEDEERKITKIANNGLSEGTKESDDLPNPNSPMDLSHIKQDQTQKITQEEEESIQELPSCSPVQSKEESDCNTKFEDNTEIKSVCDDLDITNEDIEDLERLANESDDSSKTTEPNQTSDDDAYSSCGSSQYSDDSSEDNLDFFQDQIDNVTDTNTVVDDIVKSPPNEEISEDMEACEELVEEKLEESKEEAKIIEHLTSNGSDKLVDADISKDLPENLEESKEIQDEIGKDLPENLEESKEIEDENANSEEEPSEEEPAAIDVSSNHSHKSEEVDELKSSMPTDEPVEDLQPSSSNEETVEEKEVEPTTREEDIVEEPHKISENFLTEENFEEDQVIIEETTKSDNIPEYESSPSENVMAEANTIPEENIMTEENVRTEESIMTEESIITAESSATEEHVITEENLVTEETAMEESIIETVPDTEDIVKEETPLTENAVPEESIITDKTPDIEAEVLMEETTPDEETPIQTEETQATIEDIPVVIEETIEETPVVIEETIEETPVVLEEASIEETPLVIEEATMEETPVVIEETIEETPVVLEEASIEETPVVLEEATIEETTIEETPIIIEEPKLIEEPMISDEELPQIEETKPDSIDMSANIEVPNETDVVDDPTSFVLEIASELLQINVSRDENGEKVISVTPLTKVKVIANGERVSQSEEEPEEIPAQNVDVNKNIIEPAQVEENEYDFTTIEDKLVEEEQLDVEVQQIVEDEARIVEDHVEDVVIEDYKELEDKIDDAIEENNVEEIVEVQIENNNYDTPPHLIAEKESWAQADSQDILQNEIVVENTEDIDSDGTMPVLEPMVVSEDVIEESNVKDEDKSFVLEETSSIVDLEEKSSVVEQILEENSPIVEEKSSVLEQSAIVEETSSTIEDTIEERPTEIVKEQQKTLKREKFKQSEDIITNKNKKQSQKIKRLLNSKFTKSKPLLKKKMLKKDFVMKPKKVLDENNQNLPAKPEDKITITKKSNKKLADKKPILKKKKTIEVPTESKNTETIDKSPDKNEETITKKPKCIKKDEDLKSVNKEKSLKSKTKMASYKIPKKDEKKPEVEPTKPDPNSLRKFRRIKVFKDQDDEESNKTIVKENNQVPPKTNKDDIVEITKTVNTSEETAGNKEENITMKETKKVEEENVAPAAAESTIIANKEDPDGLEKTIPKEEMKKTTKKKVQFDLTSNNNVDPQVHVESTKQNGDKIKSCLKKQMHHPQMKKYQTNGVIKHEIFKRSFSQVHRRNEYIEEQNKRKRLSLEEYNTRKKKVCNDKPEEKFQYGHPVTGLDFESAKLQEEIEEEVLKNLTSPNHEKEDISVDQEPIKVPETKKEEPRNPVTNLKLLEKSEFEEDEDLWSTPSENEEKPRGYVDKSVVEEKLNSLEEFLPKVAKIGNRRPTSEDISQKIEDLFSEKPIYEQRNYDMVLINRFLKHDNLRPDELQKVRDIVEKKKLLKVTEVTKRRHSGEVNSKTVSIDFNDFDIKKPTVEERKRDTEVIFKCQEEREIVLVEKKSVGIENITEDFELKKSEDSLSSSIEEGRELVTYNRSITAFIQQSKEKTVEAPKHSEKGSYDSSEEKHANTRILLSKTKAQLKLFEEHFRELEEESVAKEEQFPKDNSSKVVDSTIENMVEEAPKEIQEVCEEATTSQLIEVDKIEENPEETSAMIYNEDRIVETVALKVTTDDKEDNEETVQNIREHINCYDSANVRQSQNLEEEDAVDVLSSKSDVGVESAIEERETRKVYEEVSAKPEEGSPNQNGVVLDQKNEPPAELKKHEESTSKIEEVNENSGDILPKQPVKIETKKIELNHKDSNSKTEESKPVLKKADNQNLSKVKAIIEIYKRALQQPNNREKVKKIEELIEKLTNGNLKKIQNAINPALLIKANPKFKEAKTPNVYEIDKSSIQNPIKIHLKKVPEEKKKRRKRFRNLYSGNDTDEELQPKTKEMKYNSERTSSVGDYSVVQRNNTGGVPKLVIKLRKNDCRVNLQPYVKLPRMPYVENMVKRKKRTVILC